MDTARKGAPANEAPGSARGDLARRLAAAKAAAPRYHSAGTSAWITTVHAYIHIHLPSRPLRDVEQASIPHFLGSSASPCVCRGHGQEPRSIRCARGWPPRSRPHPRTVRSRLRSLSRHRTAEAGSNALASPGARAGLPVAARLQRVLGQSRPGRRGGALCPATGGASSKSHFPGRVGEVAARTWSEHRRCAPLVAAAFAAACSRERQVSPGRARGFIGVARLRAPGTDRTDHTPSQRRIHWRRRARACHSGSSGFTRSDATISSSRRASSIRVVCSFSTMHRHS